MQQKRTANSFHKKILETAAFLGPFIVKKDTAYGDATRRIVRCLKEIFPDGIPHEQIQNAYFMIQILNKFSRIATANDPFGENPWLDITGYALLAHANHELRKHTDAENTDKVRHRRRNSKRK